MNTLNVLDNGYVRFEELLGGDAAVVSAARICYQSEADHGTKDAKLIDRLIRSDHGTPFEHAVLRFEIKCPIMVMRQIVRHRIASINEKSLRYCIAERDYYIPDRTPEVDAFIEGLHGERALSYPADVATALYVAEMESGFDTYEKLLALGWKPERARAVLGTAVYTVFKWTINARSLMNFLKQRLDAHAQWETQQYAGAIYSFFRAAMPLTSNAFLDLYKERLGDLDEKFMRKEVDDV